MKTSKRSGILFFLISALILPMQARAWSEADCKKLEQDEILKKLSQEQFEVTQHEATEQPFRNAYYDNHEPGIYVDVVTGEPLFSSLDKYDSGTGWPSFTKPIDKSNIVTKKDNKLPGEERNEVRSRCGNSHLGHVFEDGPKTTGLRYCMNSSALKFIPLADLKKEGYGEYLPLFEKKTAPKHSP